MSNNTSKPNPGKFYSKLVVTTVSNKSPSEQQSIDQIIQQNVQKEVDRKTKDWNVKIFLN
jgi:hypothetical protein